MFNLLNWRTQNFTHFMGCPKVLTIFAPWLMSKFIQRTKMKLHVLQRLQLFNLPRFCPLFNHLIQSVKIWTLHPFPT